MAAYEAVKCVNALPFGMPCAGATAKRGTSRVAFTLMELLVVVAIIAMLIAILLPSLWRAKESAKQVVCLTNTHSFALATNLYAQDFDNFLLTSQPAPVPPAYYWNYKWVSQTGTAADYDYTQGLLSPYIGVQLKLYICPTIAADVGGGTGGFLTGYATNVPQQVNTKLSSLTQPMATVFIGDSKNPNSPNTVDSKLTSTYPGSIVLPNFSGRHLGKGNVGWYDGHATSEPIFLAADDPNYGKLSAAAVGYLSNRPVNVSYASVKGDATFSFVFWFNKAQGF